MEAGVHDRVGEGQDLLMRCEQGVQEFGRMGLRMGVDPVGGVGEPGDPVVEPGPETAVGKVLALGLEERSLAPNFRRNAAAAAGARRVSGPAVCP